nr:hypothetical protein [Tanacetum cinerariifolium]
MIDYTLWEVIENGATMPKTKVVEGVTTEVPITTAEEKDQRRLELEQIHPNDMEEMDLRWQIAMLTMRARRVSGRKKRAGEELVEEITKKQKVEDDKENVELKKLMETIPDEEEVAIDAIPLVVKSLRIVD